MCFILKKDSVKGTLAFCAVFPRDTVLLEFRIRCCSGAPAFYGWLDSSFSTYPIIFIFSCNSSNA